LEEHYLFLFLQIVEKKYNSITKTIKASRIYALNLNQSFPQENQTWFIFRKFLTYFSLELKLRVS
jgi:hypothetical protein